MNINGRINLLRKELGLNQKEFGSRIGLGQAGISWMEQAGNTVTEQNIAMICKEFNVDKKWLLTGEGTMFTQEKEKADLVAWATRLAYEGDTFAHRLAVTLSRLNDEQLEMIANIVEQLAANGKEKHDVNEPVALQQELTFTSYDIPEEKLSASDGDDTVGESALIVAERRE